LTPSWFLLILLAIMLVLIGLASERLSIQRLNWKPDFVKLKLSKPSIQGLSREQALFLMALLVYASTRLIGLAAYPIYFFSDEAVNTVLARNFVRDGLRSGDGEFLPTFFKNTDRYNLSTSVYLQVIPVVFFDNRVEITRGTAALATLLAAIAVALISRHVFQARAWWSATLFLSIMPAWFLHSRTAFETSLMVAFYAVCLYGYLRYRNGSQGHLYLAILAGALAFYTYSAGRIIIPLTALLLLLSDAKNHLQQGKTLRNGLILALICALPYLRFQIEHPAAVTRQLILQTSYLVEPIPAVNKLAQFASIYLQALNPLYWYVPNQVDHVRHIYAGTGHLFWLTAPFTLVGLLLTLRRIRQPAYRTLLIAMLAIPSGTAIVGVGITRILAMTIPAAILAALGLTWLVKRLPGWLPDRKAMPLLFAVLASINIWMLVNALQHGPYWHHKYDLYGMQYGSRQVFGEIERILAANPAQAIALSPTWANATDDLARFFLQQDPIPIKMASIDYYLFEIDPDIEQKLVILPAEEYAAALQSEKFKQIEVEQVLYHPNGDPGFYFVHLHYIDEIETFMAAELAERQKPLEEFVMIDGEEVLVRYSRLDMGKIEQAFDGNPHSMIRTLAANPIVLELTFSAPRRFEAIELVTGSTEVEVVATFQPGDGSQELTFQTRYTGTDLNPTGLLEIPNPIVARKVRLEISDLRQEPGKHVHIWQISFH
jgi:4-amino-4-deoxy-L-arabinose transferase-like glycosyltransferase